MKALFITTRTVDCDNHVRAWNSFSKTPADHFTYNHMGIRADHSFIEAAERSRPDIIFYIGASKASGNPRIETLQALRKIAPSINICSDAADRPWHAVLAGLRTNKCFNLQVAIDGAQDVPGVGLSTLTPVDPKPFDIEVERDIRCGFSGSVGRFNARSELVRALTWFAGLVFRERQGEGTYADHARFLKRCRMVLNVSYTGTGHAHHIKGRVIEAGWAGCALLEFSASPIADWFPSDCYVTYRDPVEAAEIMRDLDDATISRLARRLSEEVRSRFHPAMVYGEMVRLATDKGRGAIVERVVRPLSQPAA